MPLDNAPTLRDDELLLTHEFDASPALVFQLWSQAQHMQRWFGPKGFTCTHCEVDFRPGGKWVACIQSETEGPYWMGGEFREIEHGKRITSTFGDRDPARPERILDSAVEITFTDRGGGKTLQTFHQTGFPTVEMRDGHVAGWNGAFACADVYVVELADTSVPVVSAFTWVPDFARGQVRDLRVRWALEEAGRPYRARLLEQGEQGTPEYRELQPFSQVPAYREDGLELFESGAILLHIGEASEALMSTEPAARARARVWLLAALNSVEPVVQQYAELDVFAAGEEWARLRRPGLEERLNRRLSLLADALGDKDWFEGEFTIGDLMMGSVLGILRGNEVLEQHPRLAAFLERCDARPAFQRALAAHLADLSGQPPAGFAGFRPPTSGSA